MVDLSAGSLASGVKVSVNPLLEPPTALAGLTPAAVPRVEQFLARCLHPAWRIEPRLTVFGPEVKSLAGAERFRTLRSRLLQMSSAQPMHRIVVSSSLPEEGKTFVVVDAGMNDLIRPTLYEAHHEILPVKEPSPSATRTRVDVVGPVCESGDFLALDRDMVEPAPGDLLAVMSAGAYGAVQAGTYNTRPLVPEVMVRDTQWAVVRPRIEVEQLIEIDRLPSWL